MATPTTTSRPSPSSTLSPVDPRNQALATTTILTPLIIYGFCGLVLFLTFCIWRTKAPSTFMPRRRLLFGAPPRLSKGFFTWIRDLWKIPECFISETVGMDEVILLRFLWSSFAVYVVIGIMALCILIPINWSGGFLTDADLEGSPANVFNQTELSVLRRMSIENIPPESPLLYVQLAFTWIFEICILAQLWDFYRACVRSRVDAVKRDVASTVGRSVAPQYSPDGKHRLPTDQPVTTLERAKAEALAPKGELDKLEMADNFYYYDSAKNEEDKGEPVFDATFVSENLNSNSVEAYEPRGKTMKTVLSSLIQGDYMKPPDVCPKADTWGTDAHLLDEDTISLYRFIHLDLRSIMVLGLPYALQTERALVKFFETRLGVGEVEFAVVVRQHLDLQSALVKRYKYLQKMEKEWAKWLGNPPQTDVPLVEVLTAVLQGYDVESAIAQQVNQELNSSLGMDFPNSELPPISNPQSLVAAEVLLRTVGRRGSLIMEEKVLGKPLVFDDKDAPEGMVPEIPEMTEIKTEQPPDSSTASSSSANLSGFDKKSQRAFESILEALHNFRMWDDRVRHLRRYGVSKTTSVGFIVFRSTLSATTASQTLLSEWPTATALRVCPAPHPRDLIWSNLASRWASPKLKLIRNIIVWVLLVLMVFFWSIPMTYIASLLNLDTLALQYPDFATFLNAIPDWLQSLIQGFLPVLLVGIWLCLLPIILLYLTFFQGVEAYSWLDMSLFSKLWFYYFFNLILVMAVSGSVWQMIETVVTDISIVPDALASVLPSIAPFYCNYITFQAFLLMPLMLIFPFQYLGPPLRRLFINYRKSSPRQAMEAVHPFPTYTVPLGVHYPMPIIIHTIGILFSQLQPMVVPFCVVYFLVSYLAYKYVFCYMHVPAYDTRGSGFGRNGWAGMTANRAFAGPYLHILSMIGLLVVRRGVAVGVAVLVPLGVLVIIWQLWMNRTFSDYEKFVSIEMVRSSEGYLDSPLHELTVHSALATDGGPKRKRLYQDTDIVTGPIVTVTTSTNEVPKESEEPELTFDPFSRLPLTQAVDNDVVLEKTDPTILPAPLPATGPSNSTKRHLPRLDTKTGFMAPAGTLSRADQILEEAKIDVAHPVNDPEKDDDPLLWYNNDPYTQWCEPPTGNVVSGVLDHITPMVHTMDMVERIEQDPTMCSYENPAVIGRLPQLWLPGAARTIDANPNCNDPIQPKLWSPHDPDNSFAFPVPGTPGITPSSEPTIRVLDRVGTLDRKEAQQIEMLQTRENRWKGIPSVIRDSAKSLDCKIDTIGGWITSTFR